MWFVLYEVYKHTSSRRNAISAPNHPHPLTRIEERLYLGALRDVESLASGNPQGIRSVITLCEEPVRHRRPDIQYLQFPISESETQDPRFLATILSAIELAVAQGPVVVHCLLGVSRSPVILAAHLNGTGLSTFEAALEHLKELRPSVDPGVSLLRSVKSALAALASGSPARSKRSKSLPKGGER